MLDIHSYVLTNQPIKRQVWLEILQSFLEENPIAWMHVIFPLYSPRLYWGFRFLEFAIISWSCHSLQKLDLYQLRGEIHISYRVIFYLYPDVISLDFSRHESKLVCNWNAICVSFTINMLYNFKIVTYFLIQINLKRAAKL